MSCNTEPMAVPIAVNMRAMRAMNNSASGSEQRLPGRKPAARQMTKTMPPWISATVAPAERAAEHDRQPRHRRHQRFLQKAELPVPDDLDAAENRREQDAHRDDARRQELHIVAAAGAGKIGPSPKPSASRNRIGWPSEPIMRAREREYRFNCRSHRM